MVTVKILGGLGNQLFQVAYAISLSNDLDEEIKLDVSSYKNYKIRSFSLDRFEISNKVEVLNSSHSYTFFNLSTIAYRFYQKIFKTIMNKSDFGKSFFKTSSRFGYLYNFDPYYYEYKYKSKNKYIYGYFQSESYFKDSADTIKKYFKVTDDLTNKESDYLKKIKNAESIAVSMRLGDDYFKCKDLNVCSPDYYILAIKEMAKLIADVNRVFFIFSDDIEKAKVILADFNELTFIYIEDMKDYQGLRLMYNCQHFIIPNSSFSWWGAYLSDNKDKIVIGPKRWFNSAPDCDSIYFDKLRKVGNDL